MFQMVPLLPINAPGVAVISGYSLARQKEDDFSFKMSLQSISCCRIKNPIHFGKYLYITTQLNTIKSIMIRTVRNVFETHKILIFLENSSYTQDFQQLQNASRHRSAYWNQYHRLHTFKGTSNTQSRTLCSFPISLRVCNFLELKISFNA